MSPVLGATTLSLHGTSMTVLGQAQGHRGAHQGMLGHAEGPALGCQKCEAWGYDLRGFMDIFSNMFDGTCLMDRSKLKILEMTYLGGFTSHGGYPIFWLLDFNMP